MSRNSLAALLASVAVAAVAIAGFLSLGGPNTQRQMQSDQRTLQALGRLAGQVNSTYQYGKKTLPTDLHEFPRTTTLNPITQQPFVYHQKSASSYELCSSFVTDSKDQKNQNGEDFWDHPRGYHCFTLDATQTLPQIPFGY
jgi:hypothetical protein